MRSTICPKCHSRVAPSDVTCMDCGADLIDARQDIVEQAKKEARGPAGPASGAAAVANPSAAGIVLPGETAEEKRLRVFDKQEADKLRAQRPAMIVLIVIAAAVAIVMTALALNYLKQADGLASFKSLNVNAIKALGLNVYADPRIMFLTTAALALAGLLCIVGEVKRLIGTNIAIACVAAGETPNVVHISSFTQIGLLLAAFFAAPLGLILGILFKFSRDEDTRTIGGLMIYAAVAAIGLLVLNWVWSLASSIQPKQKTPVKEVEDALLFLKRWA